MYNVFFVCTFNPELLIKAMIMSSGLTIETFLPVNSLADPGVSHLIISVVSGSHTKYNCFCILIAPQFFYREGFCYFPQKHVFFFFNDFSRGGPPVL